jgi:hypothetical protein
MCTLKCEIGYVRFPQWDSIPATKNIHERTLHLADATICIIVFPILFYFPHIKTVRNENANSDGSDIKHQDINTIKHCVFQTFPLSIFWFGKQQSINSNFNLTDEMFCNWYILLSYCIVADIFVAEHESASSNNTSLWIPSRIY